MLCLMVLAAYVFGLTRNVAEPWTGMHDWNGAFFSQLARNMLRYPWEIHHGMPLAAVGEQVPPPEERSIYVTHPPGLVWLVAASFSLFGESEWAARLVPIVASAASLLLLMSLVNRRYGREVALLAGLVYAVMPLSVFYGRMVDHEAVCLAGMLAAMKCWQLCAIGGLDFGGLRYGGTFSRNQAHGLLSVGLAGGGLYASLVSGGRSVGLAAAIAFIVWIDWSGLLFAGLFCAYAVIQWRRRAATRSAALLVCATAFMATGAMLIYLVYAGLGGRWGDLAAIFTSRAGRVEEANLANIGRNTLDDFTWPVIVLGLVGLVVVLGDQLIRRPRWRVGLVGRERRAPNQPEPLARKCESRNQPEALVRKCESRNQPEPLARANAVEAQLCSANAKFLRRPRKSCDGSTQTGSVLVAASPRCDDSTVLPSGSVRAQPAASALPVLAIAGLVWLVLFPRQYQIHGYWAFYVGPVAAVLAGIALRDVRKLLARVNGPLAWLCLTLGCMLVVTAGYHGTARLIRVRWFAGEVDACRAIHRLTAPGDRLILFEDPIRPEQHGGYYFRNITPPHLAYYLDRAFDVDQNFARIAANASRYAGFVISLEQAAAHEKELGEFLGAFPAAQAGSKLYICLTRPGQAR